MVKLFPHAKPTQRANCKVGILRGADGYPLQYSHFPAEGEVKGSLVCIHGIQSHAGWYRTSCHAYSKAGFDTFFFDRRGSGRNARDRGHCSGYGQLIDDLGRCVDFVRNRNPQQSTALLAISWGGKLAVAALKQNPDLVDALVLMCPGWFAKVEPSLREKLAIGWSFLLWPKRQINVPLSDPSLFTDCPRWQQFIREEPLGLRKATARTLMASKLLDRVIRSAPPQIRVPSLLMLAGKDRIIDNEKSKAYFERFATEDRTVLEYPDAHHTFEFEEDAPKIFDDVIAWLSKRCAASSEIEKHTSG